MTGGTFAVRLDAASREFAVGEGVVKALDRVSFTIEAGAKVAIMGPSGSGKSTCLNLVGCLDTPSSGTVEVAGRATAGLSAADLARLRNVGIGFVFQHFHLLPRLSILENTELPLVYAGVASRERRKRALEVLDQVGLSSRIGHRPPELSGGQRQRAAIARALVNKPPILLADEPTGALDQGTGRTILELFDEVHQAGTTIIVVTHDPGVAAQFPRVIRLRDGRLEAP